MLSSRDQRDLGTKFNGLVLVLGFVVVVVLVSSQLFSFSCILVSWS